MIDLLPGLVASALAVLIVLRVICVVYRTHARNHRHTLLFLGFGYSYVTLGAGAIFGAVALCARPDLSGLALWLLLIGSTGLIVFDRRAARCFISGGPDCPLQNRKGKT